jgi:glycosyltransferase involved in cell wall biosynthesis
VSRRHGERSHTEPTAPRVGFVLEPILGHATHARNLERLVPPVGGIRPEFYPIPFSATGAASRVPVYRSNWSLRSGVRARKAIRAMNRREPLDGLFVHTQVPAVLSPDWLRRIPTVVSIDATPIQFDELGMQYEHAVHSATAERAKRKANEICFARAAHIVSWSAWGRDGLARDYGVPEAKVSVIAPGVDLERWRPRGRTVETHGNVVRLLFVGGDLERKGGTVLLEAFRLLRGDDRLPIELNMVTTAELAPEPGVVVHRGLTPNDPELIDLYRRSDIFCLPTTGDCLPMVLAEAGAAGLPIVSTPVGAIPEIVQPGRSGELVPPRDAAALSAALRGLIDDADRRRRFGRAAAEIVAADHDAAKNAARIVTLIIEVIEHARAART